MTELTDTQTELVYALCLARAARIENRAVFGGRARVPTPQQELKFRDAWLPSFDGLSAQPITANELAQQTGQRVTTVRKHLQHLSRFGMAREAGMKVMPQGGVEKTWIKGKDARK